MSVFCMLSIGLTGLETGAPWLYVRSRHTITPTPLTTSHTLNNSPNMRSAISDNQHVCWLLHPRDDITSCTFSCIIGCIEQ